MFAFVDFAFNVGLRRSSEVVLVLKNLPANAGRHETQVQSLGWEDLLEDGIATHSSILAWIIPWTGETSGIQPMGLQRVGQI